MILVVLLVAFFAVPFMELAVIIAVGRELGIVDTLVLLFVISVVGAWLAHRQGLGVLRAIRRELDAGRLPARHLVDGALLLVAGALLLTPGFLTDAVALLLLLPPTRAGVRAALERRFEVRVWRPVRSSRPWVVDGHSHDKEIEN